MFLDVLRRRNPDFILAAQPEVAEALVAQLSKLGIADQLERTAN